MKSRCYPIKAILGSLSCASVILQLPGRTVVGLLGSRGDILIVPAVIDSLWGCFGLVWFLMYRLLVWGMTDCNSRC